MNQSFRENRIIPITLLILVGALIMVQGPPDYSWSSYNIEAYPEREIQELVLSDLSPNYTRSVSRTADKVVISNLVTNNTPVAIACVYENQEVFLNLTNIYRITGDKLVIREHYENWKLNFTMQGENVELNFTIEMYYPPPVAVPLSIATPYFLYGVILFLLGTYLLVTVESKFRKPGWRSRDGSIAIIALVLISALFAMPLVYGYAHNSFTERIHTVATVHDYSFDLTAEYPEVTIDLLEILPDEYYSIDVRISNIYFDAPIRIRTEADMRFLSYLTEVNNFTNAEIEITVDESSTHALEIRRLNNDTHITLDMVIVRSSLVRDADISVAIIFALVSIVPAGIALSNARSLSRELGKSYRQQRTSGLWDVQD